MKLKHFTGFFALVMLTGCSAFYPETWFKGEENAHSPWHGFIYVMESRNVETRHYLGPFVTLTGCMQHLQVQTKMSGYAYYCGFNCGKDLSNPNKPLKCEKVMGSPLEALE